MQYIMHYVCEEEAVRCTARGRGLHVCGCGVCVGGGWRVCRQQPSQSHAEELSRPRYLTQAKRESERPNANLHLTVLRIDGPNHLGFCLSGPNHLGLWYMTRLLLN